MNNPAKNMYDSLGRLFQYPNDDYISSIDKCVQQLREADSPGLEPLEKFQKFAEKTSVNDLQELFTRTFEINPLCALEVGWQLFGERYERGTFIVKMRQTLRDLDLPESIELPDHLTHILQTMGRLSQQEAGEFAGLFVVPALDKMLLGLTDKEHPYRAVLQGVHDEVKSVQSKSAPSAPSAPSAQGVSHE